VTATLARGAGVVVSSILKLKTTVHYNHLIIRNSLGNVCMGLAQLQNETESALEGAQTAGCKATAWILPNGSRGELFALWILGSGNEREPRFSKPLRLPLLIGTDGRSGGPGVAVDVARNVVDPEGRQSGNR